MAAAGATAAWLVPTIIAGVGALGSAMGQQGGGGLSSSKIRELTAPFGSKKIQKFLPLQLRTGVKGGMLDQILESGIGGIRDLIRKPGGLSPSVAEAIAPRVAAESEAVSESFRGIRSQQSGAAARGNVPVSIKSALESALDVAQERAQRGVRRDALAESEVLRRQDLSQTYNILDAVLQFLNSGRMAGGEGLRAAGQLSAQQSQNQASTLALLGSLAQSASAAGAQ